MKHVVFFIVDSVRNYITGMDDRDKIKFMSDFSSQSCEFSRMISSAPSSIMSVSTMMTGIPSYFIGRNYEDFKYDSTSFISLTDILKWNGYDNIAVMNARETREKFVSLFHIAGKEYYPLGLSHAKKNWTNHEVNLVLKNVLDGNAYTKPTFFLVYYNVRLDPSTSKEVEYGYRLFKEKGLLDDSLFIMTSDHGYIDPRRGYTPERLKSMGLTHDLILSDDNIVVPFYITYPGCPLKRVEKAVSTLDIMPTVLDVLGIPYPDMNGGIRHMGHSLMPYIEGDEEPPERLVRTDARFLFQDKRVSAIRGDRYKYVFFHETSMEEFYDIQTDAMEQENLIHVGDSALQGLIQRYRETFKELEYQAVEFQLHYLFNKFTKKIRKSMSGGMPGNMCLMLMGNRTYRSMISEGIIKLYSDVPITHMQLDDENAIDLPSGILVPKSTDRMKGFFEGLSMKFDVAILACETTNQSAWLIRDSMKALAPKHFFEFDVNMDGTQQTQAKPWYHIFRVLKSRRHLYLDEPKTIFADIVRLYKLIQKRLNRTRT